MAKSAGGCALLYTHAVSHLDLNLSVEGEVRVIHDSHGHTAVHHTFRFMDLNASVLREMCEGEKEVKSQGKLQGIWLSSILVV